MQGRVVWLARNAHFGFLRPEGKADDAFFHDSAFVRDADAARVEIGDSLSFDLVPNKTPGKLKAVNVRLIEAPDEPIKYGAQ